MWKKKIGLWMVVILLSTQFFNAFGFVSQVKAKAIENSANIITSVTMSVYEKGVQVTDSVYKLSSTVKLNYNWSVPDGNDYGAGDTFTFELPEGFVLEKDFLNKKIMFEGKELGHYDIIKGSPNKVTLTFTGEVGEYFDVKGAIEVETRFDTTKFTDTLPYTIKFPINGGAEQEFTVRFKPEVSSTIDKNGAAVGTNQGNFNAKQIKWTVDVNKVMDSVYGAVVTDVIPAGLALTDISDVKVSKLNVALNGTVSPGAPLNNSQYSASLLGNTLEVKFITPDINTPITEAYRIEFVTDVIDDTKTSFENTATFKGNGTGPVSDKASVPLNHGALLKKTFLGYNSVTQDTYWTIEYNYGEKTISKAEAKLSDYYSDSQQFVPGSMKVYKLDFTKSKDSPDKVLVNDYTVSENTLTPKAGFENFELSFNNNISNAYKIEYQTRAKDRIEGETKIQNTVTTVVNGVTNDKTEYGTLKHDIISKKVGQANYADKTVSWTIKINSDEKLMNNVVITDTFPNKGLKFTDVGFTIKDKNGNLMAPSMYTLDDSKPTEGFTVKFKSSIDKSYTITYKTYFNNDWLKKSDGTTVYDWVKNEVKFLNRASVDWNDPSKPTETKTITVEDTFYPNSKAQNNGYKNGSYDAQTKEISWEIGINYNSKELAKAVLVDTLEDKQQLIEESIKVYELSIESNGNPKVGKEVTVTASSNPKLYSVDYDKKTKLLKISFNEKIAKPYLIKFTTSLKDQVVENEKIYNTAKLSDNGVPVSKDLKSEVKIPNGGKNDQYVTKTGAQDPKNETKLNWTLKINYNQSLVEDAQIIDNPDANQMFLPESFRLLPTTITKEGVVVEAGPALTQGADKDYTLEFSKDDKTGAEQFILKFNKTIEKPFILKYDSIILEAKNNGKISNFVKFSGNGSQTGTQSKESSVTVVFSDSSGIGQGTRKELAVMKVDAADSKALEGAIFNLYRVSGSEEVLFSTSIPTDKDGKTVFKDLRPGKYFLQEKTAPNGYVLDPNKYEVKFSSTTVTDMTLKNQKIATPTPTPVVTLTPIVTPTPTPTPVVTLTPIVTPTPTVTPTPVVTLTPIITPTPTPTPTPLITLTPIVTPTPTETPVSTVTPTSTPDNPTVPVATPTPVPGVIVTPTPSATPVVATPTVTPTSAPTVTPVPTSTPIVPQVTPPVEKLTTDEDIPIEGEIPLGGLPSIGDKPDHGKVTITKDGKWVYTPDPGFIGKDKFTIIVTDENGNEEEIEIEIDVEEVPTGTVTEPGDHGNKPTQLPKTGEDSALPIYLVGGSLVLIGFVLTRRFKRNN